MSGKELSAGTWCKLQYRAFEDKDKKIICQILHASKQAPQPAVGLRPRLLNKYKSFKCQKLKSGDQDEHQRRTQRQQMQSGAGRRTKILLRLFSNETPKEDWRKLRHSIKRNSKIRQEPEFIRAERNNGKKPKYPQAIYKVLGPWTLCPEEWWKGVIEYPEGLSITPRSPIGMRPRLC